MFQITVNLKDIILTADEKEVLENLESNLDKPKMLKDLAGYWFITAIISQEWLCAEAKITLYWKQYLRINKWSIPWMY